MDDSMKREIKLDSPGLRPQQRRLYRLLGQESPKPVHPKLALLFGYPLALLINQLLFWDGMGRRKDGYIFKTEFELIKEIGATPAQQRLAITKGRMHGFLEVTRKGVPAKRHYKLNFDLLVSSIIEQAELKDVVLSKGLYEWSEKSRTITERTQENTAVNRKRQSMSDIMADRFKKL